MAESQVAFHYTAASIAALRASISEPRFKPYLYEAGRNEGYAIALYLYNARLSKAFLYPLHMAEVTLRNAIVDALVLKFGPAWPSNAGFLGMLTQGGLDTLEKARTRVVRDKGRNFPVSQLVATLTFDFWSNLFRQDYDVPFWQEYLPTVLPHLPPGGGRHEAQLRVRDINQFRNRIAHHEPVIRADTTKMHKGIVDLVAARCPETALWMKHHSTLHAVIRTRPRNAGPTCQTIADICDPAVVPVREDVSLAVALNALPPAAVAFVVYDAAGLPTHGVRHDDVLRFVVGRAQDQSGLVDLNDHVMADVVAGMPAKSCAFLDAGTPLRDGVDTLCKAGVRMMMVTETRAAGVTVRGVVVRSHRRY